MFPWNFMNLTCSFFQPFFTRGVGNTNGSCSAPIITGNPDSYYYCDTNEYTVSEIRAKLHDKVSELDISTSPMSEVTGSRISRMEEKHKKLLENKDECYKKKMSEQTQEAEDEYKMACTKLFLFEREFDFYKGIKDIQCYYSCKKELKEWEAKKTTPEDMYNAYIEEYKNPNSEKYNSFCKLKDILKPKSKEDKELMYSNLYNFAIENSAEDLLFMMKLYKQDEGSDLFTDIMDCNEMTKEDRESIVDNFISAICSDLKGNKIRNLESIKALREIREQYQNEYYDNSNRKMFDKKQIKKINELIENCYSDLETFQKDEFSKECKNIENKINNLKEKITKLKTYNKSELIGELLNPMDRKEYLELAAKNHGVGYQFDLVGCETTYGNGEFDHSSKQKDGSCWLHATLTSMRYSSKGLNFINSLIYRNENGNIACYIPEADAIDEGQKNTYGIYVYNKEEIGNAISTHSQGDGDYTAYIKACDDYLLRGGREVGKGEVPGRGFEIITGLKSIYYINTDNDIPHGVAVTEGTSETNYEKMLELFNAGNAAFTTGFKSTVRCLADDVKNVDYVDPNNHDCVKEGKPFISTGHAYSVVGVEENYIYLEESNNPGMHIRISKEFFIKNAASLESYRWG